MANTFLTTADTTFTDSNNNSNIYGAAGAKEAVIIAKGVTGATIDGLVSRVQFAGQSTDYTYQQVGNALHVTDAQTGALVANVAGLSTAAEILTFANGSVPVQIVMPAAGATTAPTLTVGGVTVSATAAAAVTIPAATFDTTTYPVTTTNVSTNATSSTFLTTGLDNLVATGANNTFSAPIVNNANTLQTGDTLAGSGSDKLMATVGNSQNFAISANTTGITTVQLQAEANSADSTNNNLSQTNQVQVDAQNMNGVTRYEDNNSRSDLLVEDVRLTDSNSTAGANADHSEVVLNSDRTVNVAATNAAGTTTWQVTKDVTVAMVSTDPGHVDYGVYFDDNSLRAGSAVTSGSSSLNLQLLDGKDAAATNQPLLNNNYVAVTILVNTKPVTISLQNAAGSAVTTNYTDLLAAVNKGIAAAGLTSVSAALTSNFTLFDGVTGKVVTGQNITLTSTSPSVVLGGGVAGDASTWVTAGNSGTGGQAAISAVIVAGTPVVQTVTPLVTSTVILDDVGRGAMGGNFVDGSLATGDTSNSQGVSQFNITVDRSSQLESINSTNNALKEVYITNGANSSNASGIHNGNLTVTGQVASGNNVSANASGTVTVLSSIVAPVSTAGTANVSGTSVATTNGVGSLASNTALPTTSSNTSGVAQPLPGVVTANGGSQFNQYGFNDVRVIDASAMTGSIKFNAAITNASIAKYLTLNDSAPAVANADNANFVYTGSAQNDTITVALDPQAMANQTNNLSGREDLTLSVNGGAGDDKITVGIYTARDADGNYAAAGNTDAWYQNQKLNANITVDGGAGNDTINTPGAGDKIINGGAGADTIYTDNTGRQVVSDPSNSMVTLSQASSHATYANGEALATATWVINTADQSTADVNATARNLNNLVSDTNDTYALYLGKVAVTFDGYSSGKITIPTTSATSYVTSDLQINQAIKAAINSDPVLSKLLLAQDGPANTLVITSKIDGAYVAGDLAVNISAPSATDLSASGVSPLTVYNAQNGTNLSATSTAGAAITAATVLAQQGLDQSQNSVYFNTNTVGSMSIALANDGLHDITGAKSVTTSDNVVSPGTSDGGFDVAVLGTTIGATTLASSNEKVVLSPNFGKDVIVHFDGNADAGQDSIDFGQLFGATVAPTFGAAVTATSTKQTFDVLLGTTAATTATIATYVKTLDPSTALTNGLSYDHVYIAPNSNGSSEVYTVINDVVTDQGSLTVLGLGGQSAGGSALSMSSLLANGSFGGVATTTTLPTVTLTEGATSVNEGTAVTYTATLSSASTSAVTVPFSVTSSNAASNTDWNITGATVAGNVASGSITIPANSTTGTFTVNTVADNLTEGNSILTATLGTATGANAVATPVALTLVDSSTTPSATAVNTTLVANGTVGASSVADTFKLTGGTTSSYSTTITGFNYLNDKILVPAGSTNPSALAGGVNNVADGNVDLSWSNNGNLVTIHLTGLSANTETAMQANAVSSTVFGTY